MASRFEGKSELHFDATTGTVEDEFGEIAGVQSVMYAPPKRARARVVVVGSRLPVGYTPGTLTPGEGKLVMYRKDAMAYVKRNNDSYGERAWGERRKLFKTIYAPLDEETSLLLAQIDTFEGLLDPPGDLSFDRSREADALMVEIPIFLTGPMTINGVRIV